VVFDCATTNGAFAEFSLTVPANSTRILMHFGAQNANQATAIAKAPVINALPAATLFGIPSPDLARIVNWNIYVATAFCFGDGSGTACPCMNNGAAGNGCRNSAVMAGANLVGAGTPSLMSPAHVLTATGMPANKPCFFYQGTSQQSGGAGIVFGDGLRCAGGVPVLLGYKTTTGGMASFPSGMDPQIPVVGGIMAPGTRTYQVTYYDTAVFCTPNVFNHTNGVEIVWSM
jgi:hypothetical protein